MKPLIPLFRLWILIGQKPDLAGEVIGKTFGAGASYELLLRSNGSACRRWTVSITLAFHFL